MLELIFVMCCICLFLKHYIIAIEGRQRLESAYGQAMAALREARSESIAVEQRHNFRGKRLGGATLSRAKRPKFSVWTHRFYCLSETDDERVPSTSLRRNELVLAGLGERNVTITDVDCTPQDFQEALLTEFPRLRQGGGFELLRGAASTRQLEIIPFRISNSPRLLKAWIGTARIYIRPIQLNLDVTPTEVEEEEVGKCHTIAKLFCIRFYLVHAGYTTEVSHMSGAHTDGSAA